MKPKNKKRFSLFLLIFQLAITLKLISIDTRPEVILLWILTSLVGLYVTVSPEESFSKSTKELNIIPDNDNRLTDLK